MAKKLLIFLLACLGQFLHAQNESNIWYFGNYAGLDFNSGVPVNLTDGQINTYEGSATICDVSGQLLFYTDGLTVWDKNHQIMPNGTGLMGNPSSSQAGVIVPKPGSSTLYYVFTSEEFGNPNGFRYSEVDISLNGGLGAVTANKNVPLATPTCEKVTAVKKADNTGYWVITHEFGSNKFLSFSVTNSGINPTPVVSSIGASVTSSGGTVGYLKASPDGTKMVSCNYLKNLELYDFDAQTGQFSNVRVLNSKPGNYGAEFSPSGNVLYVTTGTTSLIQQFVQYNLQATNIAASAVTLATTISQFGALQLARDGKVYLSLASATYLGVIHQPENVGTTCNYEQNGAFIGPGMCNFGLPQFIQTYFDVFVATQSVCLGTPTQFSVSGNQNITSANWDFGDGTTSTLLTPSHLYANAGSYNVTVTAQSTAGLVMQTMKAVVAAIPVANPTTNKTVCGFNVLYNLNDHTPSILGSQTNPLFRVAYFASEANAISHTNILQSPYSLPLGTTTFYAKVYNNDNVNCYALTSFTVTMFNQLTAGQPTNYVICESPYDGIAEFNLSLKNSELLNGLDASQFVITYYKDYVDALYATGVPLPTLYTNTNVQEIVYARIENVSNAACSAVGFFTIAVAEKPVIGPLTDMVECSTGGNTAVFTLSDKNAEVLGSLSSAVFEVLYYLDMQDAIDGVDAITGPYTNTTNNQTVYVVVKAIGSSVCKDISSFNLVVLPPLPTALPLAMSVCDDSSNDGKAVFNFDDQTDLLLDNQPTGAFVVTYHASDGEAISGSNAINDYTNISNPQTIYTRITSAADVSCFVVRPFTIVVHRQPIAIAPSDLHLCSETTGLSAGVDLLSLNGTVLNGLPATDFTVSYHLLSTSAQQGIDALPNTFVATAANQVLYARVENNASASCFSVVDFQIFVYPQPVIAMKLLYTFCENSSIQVTAPPGFDAYDWSTGETTQSISVTTPGSITLTVTKDYGDVDCTATETISVVNSSMAVIKEIITSDWTDNENSIKVVVEGSGNYEYSIDGEHYQSSPEFYGLEIGEYTVYVKDINGCGIAKDEAYLLIYPKFFTPNGDGYNEKWHIKLSAYEPELRVYIFDRYGKLLTFLDGQSSGWDGTYNDHKLPSTDYWFVVERKSGKVFKGHFSLMR